jgi:segregation and condensation protein A
VTIEEKIEELRTKVKKMMRVSFHRYLSESSSKQEMVVAFLALLELVKQRVVSVKQGTLFEDIELETA